MQFVSSLSQRLSAMLRSGEELHIVDLPKTGAGKSHTGNTILQVSNLFETKRSPVSVTEVCRSETARVNRRVISFVDTPGFFDTSCSDDQLRCMIECAQGPHSFLIILKVKTFGDEVLNYAVVLFTYGDNLDDGQTIEAFVRQNSQLKDLVDKCGGRCHVIDNKHWNQQNDEYRNNRVQIDRLLNTIDEMVRMREGGCYPNELLKEVQRYVQKQTHVVIAESNGRFSEEQIRQETMNRVHTKLRMRLAGVTTGVLLGALLGACVFC
ncbi:GTPase IMAP family member 4-like [Misgurnus anguillicaudatus]|uniref:GTPase IMAP family member 4-like n=1 Tax=Misgurnus anguillicaudatus TaxID=75329 RepID=UPI003CCFB3EA